MGISINSTNRNRSKRVLRAGLAALVLSAAAIPLTGAAGAAAAAPPPRPKVPDARALSVRHAQDHVLVKLRAGAPATQLPAGATNVSGDWFSVPVRAGETIPKAIDRVDDNAALESIEVDGIVHATGAATDPLYPSQWNMPTVGAPAAWDSIYTGAGIKVAVVDSGFTAADDHACINVVDRADFTAPTAVYGSAPDENGHGTHVTGTVAECRNNGKGVAGLTTGAQIIAVRVLGGDGSGSNGNVARGIDYAVQKGAKVINLSLGFGCTTTYAGGCYSSAISEAIDRATAAGRLVVASAGNDGSGYLGFPANHPSVVSVSNVTSSLTLSSTSNRGAGLTISAPGDGIIQQTFLKDAATGAKVWNYYRFYGTSMAAPHVSAAAAILWSAHPEWNRTQITDALTRTAQDLGPAGYDTTFGAGMLRIDRALQIGNRPPTAVDGAQGLRAGLTHTRSVASYAAEPDGQAMRFDLVETGFDRSRFGFTWNASTGAFTMTVPAGTGGSTYLKFRALDPVGGSSRVATVKLDFVV